MVYNHASKVRSYMNQLTDEDPDIFLVSSDGVKVGTNKIVLRLFSSFLSEIITQPEPVSHISVPASGSVLKHLVSTLTTGVAITRDQMELKIVADVAETLGLGHIDWQVGVERKKKKGIEESTEGFIFDEGNEEASSHQDVVKMEIKPDVIGKSIDAEEMDGQRDTTGTTDSIQETVECERDDKKDTKETTGSIQERFECNACAKTFTVKSNLRNHKRLIHGDKLPKKIVTNIDRFECDECDKSFNTKKSRRQHVRKHHQETAKKEKRKPCTECQKFHGYNPKNNQHYVCDQCDKTFYGSDRYRDHKTTKHGLRSRALKVKEEYVAENPNHCHECKEACTSKTDLIYHQDTKHVAGNPDVLSCRFCDRKIDRKQKGWFMEHLRKHTGESPEICSYCGQSFKAKKSLKNHERLHTGEKPYKCEFCFAAFTQRTGLMSHQKSRSSCNISVD